MKAGLVEYYVKSKRRHKNVEEFDFYLLTDVAICFPLCHCSIAYNGHFF